MKYYNSFHLINDNILESIEGVGFYLKVYDSAENECKVGESFNSKGNVSLVVYFTDSLTDEIKSYHIKSYNNAGCSTCKQLKNGVLITFYKNDFDIASYLIQTYYPDGRLKMLQEFDSDFQLVEYREEVYNNDFVLIEEKIFYADSWTIHREEII